MVAADVSDEAPSPLAWPLLTGLVVAIVAGLVFLTLILPMMHSGPPNVAHVADLTVTLTAHPDSSSNRTADLDVRVEGPGAEDAVVSFAADMPTMDMAADSVSVSQLQAGHYQGAAKLSMGGLWEVWVLVNRPNKPQAAAHFTINV